MRSTLNQLHRTKLILGCVLLAISGAGLMILGRNLHAAWATWIPWGELGGVLIGAGVLSVGLDQYLKREQEAIEDNRYVSCSPNKHQPFAMPSSTHH